MTRAMAASFVIVAILVVGTAAVIAIALRPSAGCPTQTGGTAGTEAQLRYVDVEAGQVTFTFGPSSASDAFGIPAFSVAPLDGDAPWAAPELDTGTRRIGVSFAGASGFNPDLSPSYLGTSVRVPTTPGLVREARVLHDTGRQLAWGVILQALRCPIVTTNAYVWGKSPRAQVTLTFGQTAWITTEHTSAYVGSPILTAVLVTGMGFAPGSDVTVRFAGGDVAHARADDRGGLETSFFVPRVVPGPYEVSATDAIGRRATTRVVVTDEL